MKQVVLFSVQKNFAHRLPDVNFAPERSLRQGKSAYSELSEHTKKHPSRRESRSAELHRATGVRQRLYIQKYILLQSIARLLRIHRYTPPTAPAIGTEQDSMPGKGYSRTCPETCKYCGSKSVIREDHESGKQRQSCQDCKKTLSTRPDQHQRMSWLYVVSANLFIYLFISLFVDAAGCRGL